jgi:hypothetical protein
MCDLIRVRGTFRPYGARGLGERRRYKHPVPDGTEARRALGAKGIAHWEARAVESSGAEESFPTCEDSGGGFRTGICVQGDRLRDRVCEAPHSCWMVNLSDNLRG